MAPLAPLPQNSQAKNVRARAHGLLVHVDAPLPDLCRAAGVCGRVVARHRQLYALAGLEVSRPSCHGWWLGEEEHCRGYRCLDVHFISLSLSVCVFGADPETSSRSF